MSSRELYGPDAAEYIARAAYARAESPDVVARASYARTSSPDGQFSSGPPNDIRVRSSFTRTGSPDLQYPPVAPAKDSRASLGVHPPPAYRSSIDNV